MSTIRKNIFTDMYTYTHPKPAPRNPDPLKVKNLKPILVPGIVARPGA